MLHQETVDASAIKNRSRTITKG